MILAGGLSTRLYPLTKQVPKPLVPVAGEPNAVHVIRYLKSYGIDQIAINVHYLADRITDTLGNGSAFGVELQYLHETDLLGSAGAVKQMQHFLGGDRFVVVGCDDLTNLRLDELLAFHDEKKALATIGLVECADVAQYGVVVTNSDGKIVGFQEKPIRGTELSHSVNTGIYAFAPAIFDRIPDGHFYDFGKDVFPSLQQAGEAFYGFDAQGAYWCDIGTPDEYRRATCDVLTGTFAIPGAPRQAPVDPSARLASPDLIDGAVWIGADASLAKNVRVAGPSVIGAGVRVDEGARIERSIVWDGASIGAGAVLRNAIIGIDYAVAAGAQLEGTIAANEPALSS